MTPAEAMAIGRKFAERTGWTQKEHERLNFAVPYTDFTPLATAAADFVRWGMTERQRQAIPWMREWVETFAQLRGDFLKEHALDPAICYVPLTEKHVNFHLSKAYIRYFLAGNGCSKSTSGFLEDYYCATDQKHWRGRGGPVCVVGVQDKSWGTQVFQPKFLYGDKDNPFSPLFPEGGRWFQYYNKAGNYIDVKCRECAMALRRCTHTRRIYAASAETGWEAIQGGTFQLAHIDEHADDVKIFEELRERTRRGNTRGFITLTATPLFGDEAWEKQILWKMWNGDPEHNWLRKSIGERFVEVFQVSKYEAGLMSVEEIEAQRREMPSAVFEARVMGMPVAIAEASVFDLKKVSEMRDSQSEEPTRGELVLDPEVTIEEACEPSDVFFEAGHHTSPLRVWHKPKAKAVYIISADTAAGLAEGTGDASCAYVFEVLPGKDAVLRIRVVACWHGWIDPLEYGREVKKLAVWYNEALVIPESTGGHGWALIIKLTRELNYGNVHQDENAADQMRVKIQDRMGIDTNARSKTLMLAALQRYIHQGWILLPDREAYGELLAYEQRKVEGGKTIKYGGAQGAHDDRVMALAIACYACVQSPDAILFGTEGYS